MLLNAKIIGIGAAGNKAAIELMKEIPELTNNIILINTTLKDVPGEYKDKAFELEGTFKGCAKEREVANQIMINNLKSGNFDYVYDDKDSMCIIVTSSEGGTGSGASIMLAKYISQVYKMHIHFFIFTGFESDARGLKNTVDLFKELDSSYTVESISNKAFLDEVRGNRIKAEQLANKKFCENVKILLGGTITESNQNIDESDLLKLVNTPGYMVINNVDLGKVKNVEDYNTKLINAIDSAKYLETEATCKRLGTILNIEEKESDFIDYDNKILTERFGVPYESFSHIQHIYENNYLQYIVSGLKMPIESIENAYQEFLSVSNSVDKSKDEFFSKNYNTNNDSEFDSLTNSKVTANTDSAKEDFFKNLGVSAPNTGKFVKTVKVPENEF